MDWTTIIVSALGGGAAITGVTEIIKALVDKKKTPYDMLVGVLEEMQKYQKQRNADYEREKLDSAEKSSVIMQSHFCKHKYTNPDIICPVDKANDERLKARCKRCDLSVDNVQSANE